MGIRAGGMADFIVVVRGPPVAVTLQPLLTDVAWDSLDDPLNEAQP